jgi:hypothetical protein
MIEHKILGKQDQVNAKIRKMKEIISIKAEISKIETKRTK